MRYNFGSEGSELLGEDATASFEEVWCDAIWPWGLAPFHPGDGCLQIPVGGKGLHFLDVTRQRRHWCIGCLERVPADSDACFNLGKLVEPEQLLLGVGGDHFSLRGAQHGQWLGLHAGFLFTASKSSQNPEHLLVVSKLTGFLKMH